jgi:serine protease inhibitor ecotin
MDTLVKSVVTGALAIAIAWPLLFWSQLEDTAPYHFARSSLARSTLGTFLTTFDEEVGQSLIAQ